MSGLLQPEESVGLRAEGHPDSLKDNSSCSVMVRPPAPPVSPTLSWPQMWCDSSPLYQSLPLIPGSHVSPAPRFCCAFVLCLPIPIYNTYSCPPQPQISKPYASGTAITRALPDL